MAAVPEFGNALLKPLGAPSGKFETFIEVPFKLEGKPVRPDGVIVVTRAGKSWSAWQAARVEVNQQHEAEQRDREDVPGEIVERMVHETDVAAELDPERVDPAPSG